MIKNELFFEFWKKSILNTQIMFLASFEHAKIPLWSLQNSIDICVSFFFSWSPYFFIDWAIPTFFRSNCSKNLILFKDYLSCDLVAMLILVHEFAQYFCLIALYTNERYPSVNAKYYLVYLIKYQLLHTPELA